MNQNRQSDRAFGVTFAVIFSAIAVVGWWAYDVTLTWALVASLACLVVALVVPWVLLPLNRLWGGLTRRLGRVTNFLLLGLFFYIIMLPVGGVIRILGRDPVQRPTDPTTDSYFTAVTRHANAKTYPDMF